MRILDLGCGSGLDLASWGVVLADEVTGIDIDEARLAIARQRFPNRTYLRCAGECLPFPANSFDRVISAVALPYMNIPKTLAEVYRVLAPGGTLSLSLHPSSFTFAELLHKAIPSPLATVFRLYVITNGVWFHCAGRTAKFVNRRTESFQTERGMALSLSRAGFTDLSFHRSQQPVGETFTAEAKTSKAILYLAAAA
jgi:ubiquinone/menaquinone biosynthesis C-methylase UbiE